jgi:hypothetical protein
MTDIAPVAGNGLLDRRAFLRAGGILITGYVVNPAAAEPLSEAAWSKEPGTVVPAYGTPSKYEKAVVRTLSNPNGEPRNPLTQPSVAPANDKVVPWNPNHIPTTEPAGSVGTTGFAAGWVRRSTTSGR